MQDLVVDVSLPFAPFSGEVVTAVCSTNDTDRGGRVTPSKIVFTHSTAIRQPITVVALDDADNTLGPPRPFVVSCDVAVTGVVGRYGGTPPEFVDMVVGNVNVIQAVIGDIKVLAPGPWRAGQQHTCLTSHAGVAQVPDINGSLVSAVGGQPPTVSLVTSGSTRVVIEASASRPGPHFATEAGMVQVLVGSLPARNVTVSADGRRLEFVTPRFSDACGNGRTCVGNAAYKALKITQPSSAFPGAAVASDTLSCPPSCPGQAQPRGVFYTEQCVGYAAGAACLRASSAQTCAFGSGDLCQRCPPGAFCPGGQRVWSQPGYYTPSEASSSLVACPAPATKRCAGWDGQAGQTLCGPGYLQGSSTCSACAAAYYEQGGECVECPSESVVSGVVLPMLLLGACAAAVFGCMVTLAYCLMRRSATVDNPLAAAARHSAEFTIWTAVTMQSLVRATTCHRRPCRVLPPHAWRCPGRCCTGANRRGVDWLARVPRPHVRGAQHLRAEAAVRTPQLLQRVQPVLVRGAWDVVVASKWLPVSDAYRAWCACRPTASPICRRHLLWCRVCCHGHALLQATSGAITQGPTRTSDATEGHGNCHGGALPRDHQCGAGHPPLHSDGGG